MQSMTREMFNEDSNDDGLTIMLHWAKTFVSFTTNNEYTPDTEISPKFSSTKLQKGKPTIQNRDGKWVTRVAIDNL